jgi:hypothetical protein
VHVCIQNVMPGLVPGIHVLLTPAKTWMAGTLRAKTALHALCPAMTNQKRAS